MRTLKDVPHIPHRIVRIVQQFAAESKRLLHENVQAEYLFGSYATNRQTPLSDIDIVILVKTLTPEIRKQLSGLASEYSLEHDVYISPILKDLQVWNENKTYNTLFYQEVTEHGVPL
jgi:uncharacterized protein